MVKLCMQDLKEKQFRIGCRKRVIYNEGWKLCIFAHESLIKYFVLNSNHLTFTYSKSTIETLEKGVKYAQ